MDMMGKDSEMMAECKDCMPCLGKKECKHTMPETIHEAMPDMEDSESSDEE